MWPLINTVRCLSKSNPPIHRRSCLYLSERPASMTRERVLVSKCCSGKMYVPFSPAAIHSPRAAQEGEEGEPASQELSAAAVRARLNAGAHISRLVSRKHTRGARVSTMKRGCRRVRRWEVNDVWEGRGVSVSTARMCFEKLRVGSEGMLAPREEVICLTFCFFFRSFVLCYFHTRALALFRWLCLSRLAVRRAARREKVSQLLSFHKLSFLNVRNPVRGKVWKTHQHSSANNVLLTYYDARGYFFNLGLVFGLSFCFW